MESILKAESIWSQIKAIWGHPNSKSTSVRDRNPQTTDEKFLEVLNWRRNGSQMCKSAPTSYLKRKRRYSSTSCTNMKALLHSMILRWDCWIQRSNLQLLFTRFPTFLGSSRTFVFRSYARSCNSTRQRKARQWGSGILARALSKSLFSGQEATEGKGWWRC